MALASLAPGQAFSARYALERELGRGGMATVYLARDLERSRPVALKVLRAEVAAALGTERFLREIRLTAQLQHSHLLGLLDSGEADGCLYYTMPYVAGESLRVRLRREPQLALDAAVRIASEVAQALAYAHRQGLVHRDIKPENILLESTEAGTRALVTDFGIAQALNLAGGERLTATGMAVGTPAYMSPEQASGSRVDRRSDLYSLGCVLYEMLGGEPPYTGPTGQAILAKQVGGPVPHLRALREEVPSAVEDAVTRALAKSPADRFASAEQFASALMPGTIVPTIKVARWRARRIPVVVAALALVAAGAAGGTALLRHRAPAPPPAAISASARRIVVAVFANQTADPSLDPLGDIVADYLARGLAETRLVEVIDARAQAASDSAHAENLSGARALARSLGAGSVVWGTYSRRGDTLEFRAQLTDVTTGKLIGAIPAVVGSASQPTQGVEALRQRVMSTLAARMDPRFATYRTAIASQPTSYEAYREFLTGDTIHPMVCADPDGCFAQKLVHFRRAFALDSEFTLPIVAVAQISGFVIGKCAVTDSIADLLRPRYGRLPPYDRYRLDEAVALCHGQHAKALEAARQLMLAAPRSDLLVIGYADLARHNGRLRETIAVIDKLDPARHQHDDPYWAPYWGERIIAYHLLGEHQPELELAQEARRAVPISMEVRMWEALALVGLGRLGEVSARVEEIARMPQADIISQVGELSFFLDMIGRDLRAHGHKDAARAVFQQGIRWVKALPPGQRNRDSRVDLARLLYDADEWHEARPILKQLAAETPDDIELRAGLGAVAARLGDLREVARIDRWLAAQRRPYLNGEHTFNRARLVAVLGDRDGAVALYRQAVDEGFGFHALYGVHTDPDFESVRGYPPFDSLPGRF